MPLKGLALPICYRYVGFLFAFPSQQIPAKLATPISMPVHFLEVASWFKSPGPSCLLRRLSQQCQEILSVSSKGLIFPIYDKGSGVDSFLVQ